MVEEILGARLEERVEFLNELKLPAVITAKPEESLEELLQDEREALSALRLKYGGILFRGFGLRTAESFRAAAALAFEGGLRSYIGGVSPRAEVMAGVYESTRIPSRLRIPQHSEMVYLPDPPRAIAFFCETEPRTGGETPLADTRAIYRLLPEEMRGGLQASGISYHRYLYGPKWNIHHKTRNRIVEMHTSWMAAFSTTDPADVERACAETGGTVKWDREEGAKINHVLPAFRAHPETGEMLWFNQIASFVVSPSSAGWMRWLLYVFAYPNPLRRPMYATLGDGREFTLAQLKTINQTIDRATVRFPWKQGDLLVLDNYLVTHGRMPFKGERRVLVAIR